MNAILKFQNTITKYQTKPKYQVQEFEIWVLKFGFSDIYFRVIFTFLVGAIWIFRMCTRCFTLSATSAKA